MSKKTITTSGALSTLEEVYSSLCRLQKTMILLDCSDSDEGGAVAATVCMALKSILSEIDEVADFRRDADEEENEE